VEEKVVKQEEALLISKMKEKEVLLIFPILLLVYGIDHYLFC